MKAIVAHRVGEEGFVRFARELERLGVLTREERLDWVRLHGEIIRLVEPPLDEEALAALADKLGGRLV